MVSPSPRNADNHGYPGKMSEKDSIKIARIEETLEYVKSKLDSVHDKLEIQNERVFENTINIARIVAIGSVAVFLIPIIISILLK